jgi:hypothetical protein
MEDIGHIALLLALIIFPEIVVGAWLAYVVADAFSWMYIGYEMWVIGLFIDLTPKTQHLIEFGTPYVVAGFAAYELFKEEYLDRATNTVKKYTIDLKKH